MRPIPVICTEDLTKSYRGVEAVRKLNLAVKPHQITAFLGSNGAGKSTTIKMLLGMTKPTAGRADVLGSRIDDRPASVEVRRRVAYVSEDKRLYGYMTVKQMIRFTSSFYSDWQPDVAASLLERYALPLDRKVKSLSKGMRTKLALLLAFSRECELLILDEPSEGLDPHGVEDLLEGLVTHASAGTSIFFSTHQIADVERIADHVCILDKGRLVLDSSLDELRQSYRQINIAFRTLPAKERFQLAGVRSVKIQGHQIAVFASDNVDRIIELARDLHASSIELVPLGIREIFLQTATGN